MSFWNLRFTVAPRVGGWVPLVIFKGDFWRVYSALEICAVQVEFLGVNIFLRL